MSTAGGGGRARIFWPTELKENFYIYKKKKEIEPVVAKIETICRRAKHDDEDLRSGSGYGCCLGVPAPAVSKIKTTISRRRAKLDDDVVQDGCCCCLGLLDPAANIHVNSVLFDDDVAAAAAPPPPGSNNNMRLISSVIFDGDDSISVSMARAQRSLDGLVAFLTCLFPYLPDAEATAYLDAADMDPLAAALLVIGRRGWTRRFGYCSATTVAAVETALRCAAVAARHPDPQLFVQGWRRVSRGLAELVSHLSGPRPDYDAMNRAVARLLVRTPQPDDLELKQPWELARRRLAAAVPVVGRELPPVRGAMKRMLLATIHGFYLKALGSLPKDELAQRLHRSMLHGGYCYGPLDPVANIVVNTVWHEATFPTSKPFEVAMISTSSLWRVAARSMYGLVSFLCTRYPDLTQDLALQRLLAAGGSLRAADPHLFDHTPPPTTTIRDGDEEELDWSDCPQVGSGSAAAHITEVGTPAATVQEAYAVAAIAAFHGCIPLTPEITRSMAASDGFCLEDYRHVFSKEQSDLLSLHTKLLGSPDSMKKLRAATEALRLREGRPISKEQLDSLCVQVSRCSSSSDGTSLRQREPEPEEVARSVFFRWSRQVHSFWGQHDRVSSMVAAALEKFNRTEECQYKVHVICGVNEHVVGPEMCSSDADRGYSANNYPFKFLHSHINFLATRLGKELGDDENHPKLFFAECNNDDYQDSWCAPVSWSHPQAGQAARCYFCETRQSRIIHPALPCFHGSDFEEANFGSHTQFYYNDWLIKVEASFVDSVYHLEDDAIYLNYRVCDDDDDSDYWDSD